MPSNTCQSKIVIQYLSFNIGQPILLTQYIPPGGHPWQGGQGAASELHPQGSRADHALRGQHAGCDAANSGD